VRDDRVDEYGSFVQRDRPGTTHSQDVELLPNRLRPSLAMPSASAPGLVQAVDWLGFGGVEISDPRATEMTLLPSTSTGTKSPLSP
jgi:hypothetical protein